MSQLRIREERNGIFQRILVGIDDSEPARWAIRMASKLAKANDAEVAIIHVIPSEISLTPEFSSLRPELFADRREAGQSLLDTFAALGAFPEKPSLMLKEGEPSQQIIATAREWHPDVIVLGTHGRGAVAHMLLGSTAESVVRHAHAPVLTVGCDPAPNKCGSMAKMDPTTKISCCGACEPAMAGSGKA